MQDVEAASSTHTTFSNIFTRTQSAEMNVAFHQLTLTRPYEAQPFHVGELKWEKLGMVRMLSTRFSFQEGSPLDFFEILEGNLENVS